MVVFVLVAWCAVGGLIGWAIGSGRGRPTEGFWLGFFLGVIGWVITAFMQPSDEVMRRRADESSVLQAQVQQVEAAKVLRPCPYCAEMVQPAAVVCRFCGRDVEPTAEVPAGTPLDSRIAELEKQYPLIVNEGWHAMGFLPTQPEDKVGWLTKFCDGRRNGFSVKRASREASASAQWW